MCSSTWDCRVFWCTSPAWIHRVRRVSYSQPLLQLLVSSALLAWLHLKCQVQHMIFIPQQTTYDSHNPMFDLFSSVFLARVQRLCLTSHMLDALSNFAPAQRKYCMCEFIEGPEWRSGDSDSQPVRYSWSLRRGCSPTAQMFIVQTWLPLHLLCYLLCSLQPPRRTLQLCKAKAAPTPFPLEDTGSLPRHGNDVIERKKWSVKRESLRERRRIQWCYTASTLRPSTLRRRGSEPSHPLSPAACCCCLELWDGEVIGCNVSFT